MRFSAANIMLFHILENTPLTKVSYFPKIHYHSYIKSIVFAHTSNAVWLPQRY